MNILEEIRNPSSNELEEIHDNAVKNVKDTINEWEKIDAADIPVRNVCDLDDIASHLAYSYYHDEIEDEPDYMLLLQNPANLQNRHKKVIMGEKEYVEETPESLLDLYRGFSKSWLIDGNRDFAQNFLRCCRDQGLIKYDDWKEYISGNNFLKDFYHTNLVKYRYKPDNGYKKSQIEDGYSLIEDELRKISPEIVFVFGSDAWEQIYTELNPDIESNIKNSKHHISVAQGDTPNVTDVHGYLFSANTPVSSKIIPLAHMSGPNYSSCLRDSYFEYLQSGLEDYM